MSDGIRNYTLAIMPERVLRRAFVPALSPPSAIATQHNHWLARTARVSRSRSSTGSAIVRSWGITEPPQSSSSTAQMTPRIVRDRPWRATSIA